ncbi:MAG: glycine zipper 2TM domain-containing protein [Sulfuritalea sp.]|nr:glycine zipper 2TM domain-containing protein [Sulfuritalea sp.]
MESRNKLLYPLMVIAAIAVTLFSALGIAMMMGYLPSASSAEKSAEKQVASQPVAGAQRQAQPQRKAQAQTSAQAQSTPSRLAAVCADCGVVESIRVVEQRGSGSGLGAVAGGLTGMLVGNQFGRGDGRTAMTVLGGVGGAYAGNEIEKNVKRNTTYEVRVRLDKGGIATAHMASNPGVAVGDKVRVVNGAVVARS